MPSEVSSDENKINEDIFVELYGDYEDEKDCNYMLGFMEDKTVYLRRRIWEGNGDWTAWESYGSSSGEVDNATFANLSGCPCKVDSRP